MDLANGVINKKLESFRALFTRDDIIKSAGGAIDAYLLPSTDPHQACDFSLNITARNGNKLLDDDGFCRSRAKIFD